MSDRVSPLRLLVRTPTELVLDTPAFSVSAEDGSGRFGIRRNCEPLLVALVPSVLTYRVERSGPEVYIAVARGFLRLSHNLVEVSVRTALPCASLESVRAELTMGARALRAGESAMHEAFDSLQTKLLLHIVAEERAR